MLLNPEEKLHMRLDDIISLSDTSNKSNTRSRKGPVKKSSSRNERRLTPFNSQLNLPKKKSSNQFAIKFLLSNALAGLLIGIGGQSIRDLIEVSGASIHISSINDFYPGTTDRVLYISGSEDSVTTAQSLVWEMIATETNAESSGIPADWQPKNASGAYDSLNISSKITIPMEAAGLILGKGGANIRAIADSSNTSITISSKEEAELTRERVATISGTTEDCINCTSLILAKLSEDPDCAQYSTPGSKYPNFVSHGHSNKGNNGSNHDNGSSASFSSNLSVNSNINGFNNSGMNSSNSFQATHRTFERSDKTMRSRHSTHSSGSIQGATTLSAFTTVTLSVADHLIGCILGKQVSLCSLSLFL